MMLAVGLSYMAFIMFTYVPSVPTMMRVSKKLWYIYTMEFYTAERKKELIPFVCNGMDGTGEHYAK